MTDDNNLYRGLAPEFKSHETVNHSNYEYARGDVTTNTVEGFFSLLKRGVYGTYQHVSEAHLSRYLAEFDFRYSHREKCGVASSRRAPESATPSQSAGQRDRAAPATAAMTSGTVTVDAGTLTIAGGGTDAGTYAVDAGATLNFAGGTRTLGAGTNVTGLGTLAVTGATVNANALLDIASTGAALSVSSGTLNVGPTAASGTLAPVTLSGGVLNFNTTSPLILPSLAMSGSGGTLGGTAAVTITGDFTVTGSNATLAGPGSFTTQATSTLNAPGPCASEEELPVHQYLRLDWLRRNW